MGDHSDTTLPDSEDSQSTSRASLDYEDVTADVNFPEEVNRLSVC